MDCNDACAVEQRLHCAPWKTPTAMLREIFADMLQDHIVRDFLVSQSPAQDVHILTSPSCASKGISRTASLAELGDDASSADLGVLLVLPTHRIGNLAAGVCAESYAPSARVCATLPECQQLYHFVLDNRRHRSLALAFDHHMQVVFCRYFKNTPNVAVQLQFRLNPFLNALGRPKGRGRQINFVALHNALLFSICSKVQGLFQGPSLLPSDTGPVLRGDKLPREYREYFLPDKVIATSICTQYCSGQVVASIDKVAVVFQRDGTYGDAVSSLKRWAVTKCMASGCMPQTVSIAPARLAAAPTVGTRRERLSYAEKMDAIRDEKLERRKISKRLAAGKSNARKKQQQAQAQAKAANTGKDADAENSAT